MAKLKLAKLFFLSKLVDMNKETTGFDMKDRPILHIMINCVLILKIITSIIDM